MNKINFLATATLIIVLFSCKKDEEKVEPVNKEPNATIIVESETLWNEAMITVEASDPDGSVATVELFANDQWIGADAEAPYEFEWDTKEFEDGNVELKAVVTDDLDADSEFSKTVEVMNTLIDYDLYEGYLPMSPNFKYFTFITSKSREVLFFEQIETLPFEAKVVRSDDFDDTEFDIHFVWANGIEGQVNSYSDITPGAFAPVNSDQKGAEIGEAKVTFTDIPEHNYYTFAKLGSTTLKAESVYKAKVYENLNMGYVYLRTEDKGLYKLMTLTDGDMVTSLSSTGFEMQKHSLKITDNPSTLNFRVYGHTGPETTTPEVLLFSHYKSGDLQDYEVSYHTPDNETAFDHYSSRIGLFYDDGKSYINDFYYEVITSPIEPDIKFTLTKHTLNDIDLTVSGDSYDVLMSHYYLENNGFTLTWENFSADEDIEFPVIPTKLTNAFPKLNNSNLVFKEALATFQAQDYDHLESYKAYLETIAGRTGKSLKDGGTYNTKIGQYFVP